MERHIRKEEIQIKIAHLGEKRTLVRWLIMFTPFMTLIFLGEKKFQFVAYLRKV